MALLFSACGKTQPTNMVQENFAFADSQLRITLAEADRIRQQAGKTISELPSPRNIEADGSLRLVEGEDWCSGFFPGVLWYMYEYTQDDFWKTQAQQYSEAIVEQQNNRTTHDLGFMMYGSFGNAQRLSPSDHYREVLMQSARSLASRFNPTTGVIRSWDFNREVWQFPVIIDNMMNLDLLFWATRESGDSTFYKIAVTHADNTLKNHFRDDASSFHVVDYDTLSGKPRLFQTHQGCADSSAWARGQAWGVYGYTLCYRETGDPKYLAQAERIADFIFNNQNLPADRIPYWDYDAPNIPNAPRDVSAAAVTASGLYELAGYAQHGDKYRILADQIMDTLSSKYRVAPGQQHGFLLHSSTGHHPGGTEINVPIVYADYYYLEALLRRDKNK